MFQFDENRKYDMICLGRANLDFNPVPEEMGKKLSECNLFRKYLGGSPANISVGLAKLDKKASFLGRVADDRFGEFVMEYMAAEGVDVSKVHKCEPGVCQGLAFTEVFNGESSLIMYRNRAADLELCTEDVVEEHIKSAKMVLISGTALARSPSREAALKALELARKNDCIIVFDIDYRAYTWRNPDEIALYYGYAAKNADIIMGSREEFDLTERLLSPGNTDEESARLWFGYHAKLIVIKHGKDGSVAFTKDKEKYTIRPFPIKVVKSFGGGDGYGSAFFYSLLEGKSLKEAFTNATGSASILVSSHGCSADMPVPEELEAFVKENTKKYGAVVHVERY